MSAEGFRIEGHYPSIYSDAVPKKGEFMKLKMMKRSIVALAAAFTAMSTNALGENAAPKTLEPMVSKAVQLNDAELDGITAGTVSSISLILITPSNQSVKHINEERGRLVCINCDLIGPEFPKGKSAYGLIVIEKNGQVFEHLIGKWPVPRF